MAGLPNETQLEAYIVSRLCANGYHEADPQMYDKDSCLIPEEFIGFLKDSQPEEWDKVVTIKNGNEADAQKAIIDRFKSEMSMALPTATKNKDSHGTLSLIRHGETLDVIGGARFTLAYYKPVSNLNAQHGVLYGKNRLAVVRQLKYGVKKENENNRLDLTIFLNGMPIATIELKNALTGQTHVEAIKQYMYDRNPKGEPFFDFKRCLVHFAVGTEQVYMTTRLEGPKTRFFPFNKTLKNEGLNSDGIKTDYLWEDVLTKDNLMDLLEHFITVQVSTEQVYDPKKRQFVDKTSEALIFPRYHQRRAVHRIVDDVRAKGAGHRYLVYHSAGSGKSNTITWLAFRLASLYQENSNNALFDCIIVVTDRRVLNDQIGQNLRQFQITEGQVAFIGEGKDAYGHTSQDLKKAIEEGKRIIITTIQKFPKISNTIASYSDRRYAVIIDEAHSSQSGNDARHLRKALSLEEAEEDDRKDEEAYDEEDRINNIIEAEMKRKGDKSNVSFFAFTATPKNRTIELFCERTDGVKEPFDTYTMEQAIKEGFILDVLKGYMSFARYYKLVRNEKFEDKEYDKKQTVRLITYYVDLQDSAIEKKSRIMLEHFQAHTQNALEGKARAMLVTRSRLHAVRYKLKFDSIMQEMNMPYKALVAFSGTVKDGETNCEYTEASMNGLSENISIPQALKMPQYRILIAANKFQTGFDEPLLHTMFVDKKLGGTSIVQTLSRLNRTAHGKDMTMVLDFVNDPSKVREGFNAYYGATKMEEEDETDPNSIYDLRSKLYGFKVFNIDDVNEFATAFFGGDDKEQIKGANSVLDRVCENAINSLNDDELDEFRKTCKTFSRLYTFLSQIVNFGDVELEKLAAFCEGLYKKIPYKKIGIPYEALRETSLQSYKVVYKGRQSLSLENDVTLLKGQKPGVAPDQEEEYEWLSNIIKQLNDVYGINLTPEDEVDLKALKERIEKNETLMTFFNTNNSRDDVRQKFFEAIDAELLKYIKNKLELYKKLSNGKVNEEFKRLWFNELYDSMVRQVP